MEIPKKKKGRGLDERLGFAVHPDKVREFSYYEIYHEIDKSEFLRKLFDEALERLAKKYGPAPID